MRLAMAIRELGVREDLRQDRRAYAESRFEGGDVDEVDAHARLRHDDRAPRANRL
jgi:hypothetical protein